MALKFPYNVDALIQATIMGKLSDSRVYERNGQRTIDVGSGNILVANGLGNIQEDPPTGNRSIDLFTDNGTNNGSGAGAREYTVIGVDENLDKVVQTVVPNGLNRVTLGTDIMMWNEVYTSDQSPSTSYYGTAGAFGLETTGGATELARGVNVDEQARYICPNGYRAFVLNVNATAGSDEAGSDEEAVLQDIRFFDYAANAGNGIYRDLASLTTRSNMGRVYPGMIYLEPGQMIFLTVNNLSGTYRQRFSGGFRVIEIAEEHLS